MGCLCCIPALCQRLSRVASERLDGPGQGSSSYARTREGTVSGVKLVVVESQAKARTIEKYLGAGYRVLASYGHVRDLPPKDGSVDPEHGFAMTWETYADKARQLKAIADEAKGAESLILATDPDREGEAISWHVQEVLARKK